MILGKLFDHRTWLIEKKVKKKKKTLKLHASFPEHKIVEIKNKLNEKKKMYVIVTKFLYPDTKVISANFQRASPSTPYGISPSPPRELMFFSL